MTGLWPGTSIATDPALVPGRSRRTACWPLLVRLRRSRSSGGLHPAIQPQHCRRTPGAAAARGRPPRAVNALAIPLSVATPAARTWAITGRRSVARRRRTFLPRLAAAGMAAWAELPASSHPFTPRAWERRRMASSEMALPTADRAGGGGDEGTDKHREGQEEAFAEALRAASAAAFALSAAALI